MHSTPSWLIYGANGFTGRLLTRAARSVLAGVQRVLAGQVRNGAWTPSQAFGARICARGGRLLDRADAEGCMSELARGIAGASDTLWMSWASTRRAQLAGRA